MIESMALKDSAVRTPSMVDYKIGQKGEDTTRTDIPAARQGLLKFIAKQGGLIPMRALHTHSLVFYQAGHQAFSQIMEGLVAERACRPRGRGIPAHRQGTCIPRRGNSIVPTRCCAHLATQMRGPPAGQCASL
jgi:hypothetical protein